MGNFVPGSAFQARLQKFRDFYAENNQIGLLRSLCETSGLRASHICFIAKGRRGCVPETLDKLENAAEAFLRAKKKNRKS